ncbi:MAG: hypothetical protein ABSH05_14985 [Bryobacteraceae bacterium]
MHSKTDLRAVGLFVTIILLRFLPANAATPVQVDTKNLVVTVDGTACR